jgi:GABA(A) receptor-associated protein
MEFYSKFVAAPLEERQTQSFRLIKRFPDKYPVIIDRCSRRDPGLDKNKYIIPNDQTLSQIMYLIRKRLRLRPEQAIFFFFEGSLLSGNMTLSQLHHLCSLKKNDGFTYLLYSLENTFG